jgi:hypothetical protein
VYYLDERRYLDLGRIGEINPQAIWLDKNGVVYTTDDYGFILRIDPDTHEITKLEAQCPHMPHRNGWHNVAYDVVPSPDGETFFGVSWSYDNFLWEFDPRKSGRDAMINHGCVWAAKGWNNDFELQLNNLRGLTFGADNKIYYVGRNGWDELKQQTLLRSDPVSGEQEILGTIDFPGRHDVHIATGVFDFYGNLYFAEAVVHPTSLYVYRPDSVTKDKKVFGWKDVKPWG